MKDASGTIRPNNGERNAPPSEAQGNEAMWGWIAGAVVFVLMLVFLFGGGEKTSVQEPLDLGNCRLYDVGGGIGQDSLITLDCGSKKSYIFRRIE